MVTKFVQFLSFLLLVALLVPMANAQTVKISRDDVMGGYSRTHSDGEAMDTMQISESITHQNDKVFVTIRTLAETHDENALASSCSLDQDFTLSADNKTLTSNSMISGDVCKISLKMIEDGRFQIHANAACELEMCGQGNAHLDGVILSRSDYDIGN